MRNVTITMDDDMARWLRLEAAKGDVSVSKFVRRVLYSEMTHSQSYEAARDRYLARSPIPISDGSPYPSRAQIYDRGVRR